jgi:uncharacterized protein
MRGEPQLEIDLAELALSSGEAARLDLNLQPRPPVVGGEPLSVGSEPAEIRVDVSRTTAGHALRLRGDVHVTGTCARCLEPAGRVVAIDAREVDQVGDEDSELRSPYVVEGRLDVDSWAHDALRLALPERLLCRPECAGLCAECGVSLNDVDPAEHRHEPPRDPRFAALGKLLE